MDSLPHLVVQAAAATLALALAAADGLASLAPPGFQPIVHLAALVLLAIVAWRLAVRAVRAAVALAELLAVLAAALLLLPFRAPAWAWRRLRERRRPPPLPSGAAKRPPPAARGFVDIDEAAAPGEERGRTTKAATALLAMTLDHDSATLSGTVLSGPLAGRTLDSLELRELLGLHAEADRSDRTSVALLESYLDRHRSGWRLVAAQEPPPAAAPEPSPYAAALRVLEIDPAAPADRAAVKARYRELARRNHPDQGGSTDLFQRINEAYEVIRAHHGWPR